MSHVSIGEPVGWPHVHISLDESVANTYRTVQQCASFTYCLNDEVAIEANRGEFKVNNILVGNDAIELNQYVLENVFRFRYLDWK